MTEETGEAEQGRWRCRYNVSGSVVTTPCTLHLEAMVEEQQDCKCVADATGIFTDSGKEGVELEEARLGTHNLHDLCARGSRFFFTVSPTGFQLAFYDEQEQERKLGELRARALPVAGNPGFGLARWVRSHQPPTPTLPYPTTHDDTTDGHDSVQPLEIVEERKDGERQHVGSMEEDKIENNNTPCGSEKEVA